MSIWGKMATKLMILLAIVAMAEAREQRWFGFEKKIAQERKSPVILVPGTGGSQIYARLTDEYESPSFWCWRWGRTDYFRLYLDLFGVLPPFTSCFSQRMKLEYDDSTQRFRNSLGVETMVPNFGSTKAMQYLDPNFRSSTSYMRTLIKTLVTKGYEEGKTLFGAPYDFRYAPGSNAADVAIEFLKNFKDLIENASNANGGLPVQIVAHSLGGLWSTYLLNQQDLEWRQKYVSHFISIAAPWAGSVQQVLTYASGYTQGVPFVDPLILRTEERTLESNLWLLPLPDVFESSVFLTTPSKNYTAADLQDLFYDLGMPEGWDHYLTRVPELVQSLRAPLIPVTLIFGEGVNTAETLLYKKYGFDYQPDILYGDGDGTVNLISLTSVVEDWTSVAGQNLTVIRAPNQTHLGIISNSVGIDLIVQQIERVKF